MENARTDIFDKEILIDKIRAILYVEADKNPEEMDDSLVAECAGFLMELENKKILSQEEIDKAVSILMRNYDRIHRKKRSLKALLIAAAVIVSMLLANVVASAFGYNLFNSIVNSLGEAFVEMIEGDKTEYNGLTVIKGSDVVSYNSVEEFLEAENLPVLYPEGIFYGSDSVVSVKIRDSFDDKNKNYNPDYKDIRYVTDSSDGTSIIISTHPTSNRQFLNNDSLEFEIINGFECYILKDPTLVHCNFIHNGYVYSIYTSAYEKLVNIINGLKENVR